MPKLQNALWDQLIAEFPPLWNPQDLCFRDLHVRNQCRQLLLEKANRVSSVPITMESLRKRLRNVNKRLRNGGYRESLGSENTLLIPSQTPQLASANPDSTQQIIGRVCLRELAADYPCLWDSQDVNYTNTLMKTNCEQQLLVKYNNLSSTPITMAQLQLKLQDLIQQREGGMPTESQEERRPPDLPSWGRLEDLSAEYPCLWDPKTPGYHNRRLKDLCLKELLEKYNSLSSYQINYSRLRTMILSMRRRQKRKAAARRSEETRGDWQSDLGNSSDSTDQANMNNQAAVLSIVFHCCAVCGEVKSECLNHTDRCYIVNNKTTLKMNNLSVDLNFDADATICQNCDTKLKEMHEFFNLVKNAQDKMNAVNISDIIDIDDENEDQKLIIDEVTVTDTELVKPTVSYKRKGDETSELKKKCRVTIDLNSCDDKSTMDDIAKYQMFKNDGIVMDTNDANGGLKVIDTGDSEEVNFHIKEEIETNDVHEEVDETGEMSTDDDKSNIVSAHTRDSENVIKQSENKHKEVETSKIVSQETKTNDIHGNGEVVSKEDVRNGVMDEHTDDTEITSAAVSIVNALASKEPVCVMPKSELIGLVESIVSRMLNK